MRAGVLPERMSLDASPLPVMPNTTAAASSAPAAAIPRISNLSSFITSELLVRRHIAGLRHLAHLVVVGVLHVREALDQRRLQDLDLLAANLDSVVRLKLHERLLYPLRQPLVNLLANAEAAIRD